MNKFLSILAVGLFVAHSAYATEHLTLLTDRSALHVEPLVQMFEKEADVKVSVIYTKEGTIRDRVTDPSVDVVYSTEVTEMEEIEPHLAKLNLDPSQFNSELISENLKWVSPSFRVRGAYHKIGVDVQQWDDLKQHTVCIRPLVHPYNISMFQALSKEYPNIDQYMRMINDVMVKPASGNDRKQAQLMHEGKCDVAILNSYYVKVMNADPAYANVVVNKEFTPITINGKYVALQSAMAVTKDTDINRRFINFVLGAKAQDFIVKDVGEYSYNTKMDIITAAHKYTRRDVFEMITNVTK